MKKQPVIYREGPRVYLRPVEEGDLPFFARGINDPTFTPYLGTWRPMSMESERAWFVGLKERADDIVLAIVAKHGHKLIGNIGLHGINWVNRNATQGTAIFDKRYWGEGYGTEARMLLLSIAFLTLGLERVSSKVLATNPRSLRGNQKLGYKVEGRQRRAFYKNGRFVDDILLGCLRRDWLPIWKRFQTTRRV
jgi:diamine N-acetyltransferase